MKKFSLLLFIVIFITNTASAQMTIRTLRDSLFIPWELVYGPDNHIWFTQKNGYICRLDPVSRKIDTLYHETNTVIQNEGGMLGMVLHPNFPNPPFVYVAFNYLNGTAYAERVVKYQYNAANEQLHTPQVVIDNINAANIHNGARLLMIGDQLYITTGDAATSSIAQNTTSINGKTLRVNQDGSIPADNPIPGSAVWSWGHRNAQGIVYANGKIYQSEHGPSNDDEINIIQKGRNFGWPSVQGYCNTSSEITFCNDSNVVEPIMAWTPTLAVSGLDYYDHPMFPALQKSLIMATLKDAHLYQLKLNGTLDSITAATIINTVNAGRLRDVCISPEGRIYISTSNSNAAGSGPRVDKILELYDPSFVSVPKHTSDNFIKIYPNPARTFVTISVNAPGKNDIHYTVANAVGQIIASGIMSNQNAIINTAHWQPGIYTVKVFDNAEINISQKLVRSE